MRIKVPNWTAVSDRYLQNSTKTAGMILLSRDNRVQSSMHPPPSVHRIDSSASQSFQCSLPRQDKRIRVKIDGDPSQVTWSRRVRACPEDREDQEGKRRRGRKKEEKKPGLGGGMGMRRRHQTLRRRTGAEVLQCSSILHVLVEARN